MPIRLRTYGLAMCGTLLGGVILYVAVPRHGASSDSQIAGVQSKTEVNHPQAGERRSQDGVLQQTAWIQLATVDGEGQPAAKRPVVRLVEPGEAASDPNKTFAVPKVATPKADPSTVRVAGEPRTANELLQPQSEQLKGRVKLETGREARLNPADSANTTSKTPGPVKTTIAKKEKSSLSVAPNRPPVVAAAPSATSETDSVQAPPAETAAVDVAEAKSTPTDSASPAPAATANQPAARRAANPPTVAAAIAPRDDVVTDAAQPPATLPETDSPPASEDVVTTSPPAPQRIPPVTALPHDEPTSTAATVKRIPLVDREAETAARANPPDRTPAAGVAQSPAKGFVAVPTATDIYASPISARAQEHVAYGFDLAERGALYSAESEFIQALQLIAQALDAREPRKGHSRALATGLKALEEAEDFVPRSDRLEPSIAQIVAAHTTPIAEDVREEQAPLVVAMQRYYAFATSQLTTAGGHDPAASMALYGLARLQPALVAEPGTKRTLRGPKAMALYQACLTIDGRNYLAANELGVLFARYGQWHEAEAALLHSVRISPKAENWQNLAECAEKLGNVQGASYARSEQKRAIANRHKNGGAVGDRPPLKFVDPETFVRESGSGGTDALLTGVEGARTTATPPPAKVEEKEKTEGVREWLNSKMPGSLARRAEKNPPEAK